MSPGFQETLQRNLGIETIRQGNFNPTTFRKTARVLHGEERAEKLGWAVAVTSLSQQGHSTVVRKVFLEISHDVLFWIRKREIGISNYHEITSVQRRRMLGKA